MSTYDEIRELVRTVKEGERTEREKALCNLWLLDNSLDEQSQDFLEKVFVSVGSDERGDLRLFQSVSVALAKYGDLKTLMVKELLWPRLIRWIEAVAVNPESTSDKVGLGDLLAYEALAGLSRFLEYRAEVTAELIRIIGMPGQEQGTDSLSDLQKQVYQYLHDDVFTAIATLGDGKGVDFLKHWKDSGNLTAAVALEHFGKPYDTIRKAVQKLEGDV